MNTHKQDWWMEEFDSIFSYVGWIPEHKERILAFIKSVAKKERELAIEESEAYEKGFNAGWEEAKVHEERLMELGRRAGIEECVDLVNQRAQSFFPRRWKPEDAREVVEIGKKYEASQLILADLLHLKQKLTPPKQ